VYLHAIVTGIGEGMSGSVIHDFFMGATLNPRLFAGRDTECACARHIIHRTVCHPVHAATSSTAHYTGARHVVHQNMYMYSLRHLPHTLTVLATSSTASN